MKIFEIVAAAKAANAEIFGKVNEPRATKIVIAALQEITKKIEATTEGPIVVARFGRFVVKRVQPEASDAAHSSASALAARTSGPKAPRANRRIIFHPVNQAAAAAKAPKKA